MNITRREKEVLIKLAEGFTTIQIGQFYGISPRTVQEHLNNLRGRIGAANHAHLITLAFRKKIIS